MCVIQVTSVNEFSPQFTTYGTTITIPENITVASLVYHVNATDADFGPDGELR